MLRQQQYQEKLEAEWVERRAAWEARAAADRERQRRQMEVQEQEYLRAMAAAKAAKDVRRQEADAAQREAQQVGKPAVLFILQVLGIRVMWICML